MMMMFDAL